MVIYTVIISERGKQWQIASSKMATAITPGPSALLESCPFPTKNQEIESTPTPLKASQTFVTTPMNRRWWKCSAWLHRLGHPASSWFSVLKHVPYSSEPPVRSPHPEETLREDRSLNMDSNLSIPWVPHLQNGNNSFL